jgi:hypothetical protein
MKHLPSIEALTAADDRRLLAELKICAALEKLARVRALVDRADQLLTTVLACGEHVARDEAADALADSELAAILTSVRSAKKI